MTRERILIVEDEFLIADLLADMVDEIGMDVCSIVDTADEAVRQAVACHPSAILMDIRLKGQRDGIDAAVAIHREFACPVIFITGSQEPSTVAKINRDHPAALLFKPIMFEQLRATIASVLGDRMQQPAGR